MNKLITHFFIIVSFSIVFILLFYFQSQETITYFPIDKEHSFEKKDTKLSVTEADSLNYQLHWDSYSQTNKPLYLRQDVSLLYQNGKLRGAKSTWKNEVNAIKINHVSSYSTEALWEAISYHHGEVHGQNQSINSLHAITKDSLYVSNNMSGEIGYFKKPLNKNEKNMKEKQDEKTQTALLTHWNTLLKHFNIATQNYTCIPLTEMNKFTRTPLPNLTQEETDKVLGQLWEGLYKNYILTIMNSNSHSLKSYIPIILLDKSNDHLLVLYELNSKKELLKQKISN